MVDSQVTFELSVWPRPNWTFPQTFIINLVSQSIEFIFIEGVLYKQNPAINLETV